MAAPFLREGTLRLLRRGVGSVPVAQAGLPQLRCVQFFGSTHFLHSCTPRMHVEEKSGVGLPAVGAQTSMTTQLWRMRHALRSDDQAKAKETKPQTVLITKAPIPTAIRYPFATDPVLREEYQNPWGKVRLGKILEDLDSLAGTIAFIHCDDDDPTTFAQLIVTASVDEIHQYGSLSLDTDLVLSGAVTWVGRSSMSIRMEATQTDANGDPRSSPSLSADFTFVARDPLSNKAALINPLEPDTAEARALFKAGELKAAQRKAKRSISSGVVDTPQKQQFIQASMLESRKLLDLPTLADNNAVLIHKTRLENMFLCQPQQRNMAGRVFGGFIMRRAFELAFATSYVFGGSRPIFLDVDEITFQRPVDVGNLLRMRSVVLHASPANNETDKRVLNSKHITVPIVGIIHVEVNAYVTLPEKSSSVTSNTLNFRFAIEKANDTHVLKTVLPETEAEARRIYEVVHMGI